MKTRSNKRDSRPTKEVPPQSIKKLKKLDLEESAEIQVPKLKVHCEKPCSQKEEIIADLDEFLAGSEVEDECLKELEVPKLMPAKSRNNLRCNPKLKDEDEAAFIGDPIPMKEAMERWPKRYAYKNKGNKVDQRNGILNEDSKYEEILQAKHHYNQAVVDGCLYSLLDNAFVKSEEGSADYIARITELFDAVDGELYFRAQWFFRAEDTVIKELNAHLVDKHRVFISDSVDDNPLDCIVSKVNIVKVDCNDDLSLIPPCDLYYNMSFQPRFLTFSNIAKGESEKNDSMDSTISSDCNSGIGASDKSVDSEMTLLDLYAGCGAMSTGLCLGASLSGVKLVNRWAVDINSDACKSLKFNHPETQVRNEAANDFLLLLKEWAVLCETYYLLDSEPNSDESDDDEATNKPNSQKGEFEVGKLLNICYGDPNNVNKPGVYFEVRWKGYGPEEDTWEPIDGLSNCEESIKAFVSKGVRSKILPLPGTVDFICGGPPCQGVSGFNRFRNAAAPLDDPKNHQLVVFMDIINYLKPKYVLMENVVDLVRFSDGFLGRHAVGRLIGMNYQTRMGIVTAGSYGLPQVRLRVFLWGALTSQELPPFPLPTHYIIGRGNIPNEFEDIAVQYDVKNAPPLETAINLADALSDLPKVKTTENRDEMPYGNAVPTSFQYHIKLRKKGLSEHMLYDHRPLRINDDDQARVDRIPKQKGANFRNLPGVLVNADNRVEWDPNVEMVYLPNGKQLVPNYAMKFVFGRSLKPFGRLWWDEIVTTVVTRAEPHNQAVLHPEQDRVLTIRENARIQGFPDYYKLFGNVKERYMQVGNAVAVPVGLALGYSLGKAIRGEHDRSPLLNLPFKYPDCLAQVFNSMV